MKTYKPVSYFYIKLGVSRQRFHQILEAYSVELPEPDAMVGARKLWSEESVEKFLSDIRALRTRKAKVAKVMAERPDLTTIRRFVETKSASLEDRKGFSVRVSVLASAGKIHKEKYGNSSFYKTSELEEIYDKSYPVTFPSVPVAGLPELLAKNPNTISLEGFSEKTGLPMPTLLGRFYKATPRLTPVFRAGGKNFYDKQEVMNLLKFADLRKIVARAKDSELREMADKMSEASAKV